MSMRFPYHSLPTTGPIWTLGGRAERPKALVTVALLGPAATIPRAGLLDTGADDTSFGDQVALLAGIDLAQAPLGQAMGIGGTPIQVRYAEVTLRLSDGVESREWFARVAFAPLAMRWALLGFAGCLQFFDATFRGADEQVELVTNRLYTGT